MSVQTSVQCRHRNQQLQWRTFCWSFSFDFCSSDSSCPCDLGTETCLDFAPRQLCATIQKIGRTEHTEPGSPWFQVHIMFAPVFMNLQQNRWKTHCPACYSCLRTDHVLSTTWLRHPRRGGNGIGSAPSIPRTGMMYPPSVVHEMVDGIGFTTLGPNRIILGERQNRKDVEASEQIREIATPCTPRGHISSPFSQEHLFMSLLDVRLGV